MRVGLDIGSTTIKCVVLDEAGRLVFSDYERHYSHILEKSEELLNRVCATYVPDGVAQLAISGSAGMGMADAVGVPFVQEVFATRVAANRLSPGTDCIIELGGEDAKILFLSGAMEVRMNGSCAGGTGAFIDQMATLLKLSAEELNERARHAEKTYTIASRCGVFAKSDIQPLINQGARTEDIAASIYQAVVNQTIAGLAQGRPITGKVLYLGGPLTFSDVLRGSFDRTLGVEGVCPENSLYYVAMGAALYSDKSFDLREAAARMRTRGQTADDALYLQEGQSRQDAAGRKLRLVHNGVGIQGLLHEQFYNDFFIPRKAVEDLREDGRGLWFDGRRHGRRRLRHHDLMGLFLLLLFKCLAGGDLCHIRVMEGVVSHNVALGNHAFYQVRAGFQVISN